MEIITITLNGVEVSGHPGMTILDLAHESGVDIPTLCYDPLLRSIGACRLCVVEEEHSGALLASCVTPIASGMVINTNSPRVMERRRTILELMLASHPDSCLVCDKGNRCELRKIASDMGIGVIGLERIPQPATIQEINPFIERDLSKCILCAKCIRACQELVVNGALDYFGRGFAVRPATLGNLPLESSECTFCGTCVAFCPTGALKEKNTPYQGTTSQVVHTTCPFCGCGCDICLEVKDDRLIRARPDKEGINQGTLCVRGAYGLDFVNSPERLIAPLARIDGNLEKVSWEKALEIAALGLKHVKEEYGPQSLAILGSPRCTNEENYLLSRFARGVLGTNNIDNGSRLYSPATRVGLGQSLGFLNSTNPLPDLEHAEVILLIGANPSFSNPLVEYVIKRTVKQKGGRLILVDPRKTGLSSFSYLWLRPRVGTDVALINGMAKSIIDEGLMDEEYVSRRTDNFEELSKNLEKYSLNFAEEVTRVPSQDIRQAARLFAQARKAAIVYGNGITQVSGSSGVTALANLAMLTGNTRAQGGGIYPLQRESNAQGACDMGSLPDFLPGYQSVEDTKSRRKFEECWGINLPANKGLTALEIMEGARSGKIKGIYIVGENPVLSFPRPDLVREALSSLTILVVQDMFLTETGELATLILPAASFAEKEGTFTNFEGRVCKVRRALNPQGESLPDGEIILKLASRMGFPLPYSSPQEAMGEICELVPWYGEDLELEKSGESSTRGSIHQGQLLKGFPRFRPVEYTPKIAAGDSYPFTLMVGTVLYQFGSGSRSSRSPRLREFFLEPFLEVSDPDAKDLGVALGDKVKVISKVGEITAKTRIVDTLSQGMLFMPLPSPKNPVNALFDIDLDPQTKAPALKACRVKLERIS
jgi:formate dehydrogenase alpha subunit